MLGTGEQEKSIAEATFGLRNIPWFDYDPEAVRIFKGIVRIKYLLCRIRYANNNDRNSDRQKRPLEKLY